MTRHVHVPDAVFDALHGHFTSAEVVELTATIAAYGMVSRFLVALQVELPAPAADPGAGPAATDPEADPEPAAGLATEPAAESAPRRTT
jgi:hypothetical protein